MHFNSNENREVRVSYRCKFMSVGVERIYNLAAVGWLEICSCVLFQTREKEFRTIIRE